jgi:hypothetical protein
MSIKALVLCFFSISLDLNNFLVDCSSSHKRAYLNREKTSILSIEGRIMHFQWLYFILLAAILGGPLEISARASMIRVTRYNECKY